MRIQQTQKAKTYSPQLGALSIALVMAMTGCTSVPPPSELPDGIESVRKISVDVPPAETLGLSSQKMTMTLGIGSGLTMTRRSGDTVELYFVTDRGPNTDLEVYGFQKNMEKIQPGKVFPSPGFQPRFGKLSVDLRAGKAKVIDTTALSREGRPVTGIPPNLSHSQIREIALDEKGQDLGFDANGIDPEGIALVGADTLFIADEYRPSILRVKATTGNVEKMLAPGDGLPSVFGKRRPNRGFEGLTTTPNGAIVAVVQSTLELGDDKNSTKEAFFIRGLKIQDDTSTQFAIPIDQRFAKNSDAKIGDIAALDENRLLVLIQGKTPQGEINAFIVLADISESCDPEKTKLSDGRSLEFAKTLQEFSARCKTAQPTNVVNLKTLGWSHEKTEGIAVIGNRELLVINDNDFGISPDFPQAPTDMLYIKLSKPLLGAQIPERKKK